MKTADPHDRMGVYKRIEDVPTRYRLENHASAYEGRDTWSEWAVEATQQYTSERYALWLDRTRRSWKDHMDERGRHHALATPDDVEAWSEKLLERCKPLSAYQIYYTKLESFYDWLYIHTRHPHVYHPVWMAAAEGEATGKIWDYKMKRRND
jgi:hypothetical protein